MKDLQNLLDAFVALSGRVPWLDRHIDLDLFETAHQVDCKNRPKILQTDKMQLPDEYHGGKYGVYIIWSEDRSCCYVGKASQQGSHLSKRVWAHLGTDRQYREDVKESVELALKNMFRCKFHGKFHKARFLTIIPVPARFRWFASALEEFLIEELPSDWNKVGKK